MDQVEKMLKLADESLASLEGYYTRQIRDGEFVLAYKNLFWAAREHFECGLFRWRRGDSPVPDFEAVLEFGERLRAGEADWDLPERTIIGQSTKWFFVWHVGNLLDRPDFVTAKQIATYRKLKENVHPQERAADVLLGFKIIEALAGRPWRDGFEDLITELGSKKRQLLAAHTYRTYFDLLNAKEQGEEVIAPLIEEAESNYAKRKRDAFYGGGFAFMGGTDDNPYVVDFVLAAIMKHLGWTGESIHRWRW